MVPIALLAIGAIGASVQHVIEPAHAASFGGLVVTSLGAWSEQTAPPPPPPPPPPPGPLACDDFDMSPGPLDGRPTGCGPTWSAPGNWAVSGGTLAVSGASGTAVVPIGLTDVTVAVDVIGGNANNRRAGVVHSHASAGPTYLVATLEGTTTIRLELHQGNAVTTLASATIANTVTWRISVSRSGSTVGVTVNGTPVIGVTLTPAQSALLTGTGAGLYKGQGPPADFDDFEVTPT